MAGTSEQTLEPVRQFARADATRFRLRDSLRAQEIARLTGGYQFIFVEAGMIHFYLWQQLWRKLKGAFQVQPVFLDRAALQLPVKPMKSTVSRRSVSYHSKTA